MPLLKTKFFSINIFTGLLFCFTFLIIPGHLFGQDQAFVYGKIKTVSGKAIEGANIAVVGEPGGFTTLKDGSYELSIPAGKTITIGVSHIGYEPFRKELNAVAGDRIELNITLTITSTSLPSVEIRSGEMRNTSFTHIDPKLATQVPNASGSFEAVLKTLPGVVSNNELTSQYSVRGGNYDENLVYVNDVEIYRPLLVRSGQQEGLSFINSDLVSGVSFSAGGFDAVYGDKLSSVLDIKYRRPTEFSGSANASLLGGGLHLEGADKKGRISYLIGGRYKTSQYLLKSLETKGEYKPRFGDIQGIVSWNINQKTELSLLGNYSVNRYQVIPETRQTEFGTINEALRLTIYFDGQEIDSYNTTTGALTLTKTITDSLRLKFIASAYRSDESEHFDIQGQYYIDELEKDIGASNFGDVAFNRGIGTYIQHARNDLTATVYSIEHKGYYDRAHSHVQWGARYQHEIIDDYLSEWVYIDSAEYSLPHPPDSIGFPGNLNQQVQLQEVIKTNSGLSSNRIQGYVQDEWSWGNKVMYSFNAGARVNYWDLNGQTVFSPRASFSIKPDWKRKMQFRIATGFYYQPPFYRELRDPEGQVHTDVKAQQSIHFILGTDYMFLMWGREFKLVGEAYYKKLDNLVPYKIDNLRIRYLPEESSKGYAAGMDFRLNGEFVNGVESWASLSLLKTQEDIKGDYYYTYYNSDGEVIVPGYSINDIATDSTRTEPGYIPRPTDQRLTFSLFFQDYLPKSPTLKMNMTLVYGTGLPFGPPGYDKYKDILRFPPYRRVDIGFTKIVIDEDQKKDYRLGIANKINSFWISLEIFNLLQVNNTVSYLWVTDVTNRRYAVPNYLSARTVNLRFNVTF